MLVPIKDIFISNRQRKTMDAAKVLDLANDIDARGMLHPIVLRSPHEGEDTGGLPYVLMVGGRRTAAHIMLGRKEIEARLKDDLSPLEARIAELNENVVREDLTWQEEVDARAELAALIRQQNPNAVHAEVANEVGVSEAQLSKDITLHKAIKADPSLKAAGSKGSALRIADHKRTIQTRINNVERAGSSLSVLRSKLFTADARDFLRSQPTHSVDMVFSDLPYGLDYYATVASDAANKHVSTYDDSQGTTKDFIVDVIPEALRVVKPSGWVVFFMCYELHNWLMSLCRDTCLVHYAYREEGTTVVRECTAAHDGRPCIFTIPELPPWIWTRRGGGNNGHWPELHAANRYEMLVVVNAGSAKLVKKPVENVLDFPPLTGERLHSMQKPHELCVEIIERCTVPGELVLDFCFGSGAHMAAAASIHRDFLGCDSNPDNLSSAITLVAPHYKPQTSILSLT